MNNVLRLALSATLLCACSSPEPGSDEGSGGAAITAEAGTPAWQQQIEARLAGDWPAVYAAALDRGVSPTPLQPVLLGDEPVALQRSTFLATLYADGDWAPVFVGPEGLSERGRVVRDTLLAAGEHALDPLDYLSEEDLAWLQRYAELSAARDAIPALPLTVEEREALLAFADDPAVRSSDAPTEALIERLLGGDPPAALAAWSAAHAERLELERTWVGAGALVEAALADGLLAYAFDQRHFNPHYLGLENPTDDEKHAAIAERMRETFRNAAATGGASEMQAFLDALPPSHPQYAGLLAERARYAQIVAEGGWDVVEPRSLRRGSSGTRVLELKRRLHAEGYFDGDLEDDTFGDTLRDAVRHYQQTHQMEVTGESSRDFWSSLNIPAERRLAQIELTLERWRENRIGDDDRYLWVNIPDMHAEAWRGGEREMRFRIVVGNTTRQCDPQTGQMRYVNATPIQSATLSYVVLNPTWSVPIRIAREELLPELLENPNYFEEQGFEHIINDNGSEIIRQAPGPNNPLGRVKFMFPNIHNTYMHDTSRPVYFQYPIRAFSHGCMRVSEPDELLEYLLRADGQWDDDQVAEIYESQEETTISLREHVPVHIEYYVVTVDDDGRANFLADIYRYDRDRMNPPDPRDNECEPEPTPDHRLVLVEGELMFEDLEGVQYTRAEWEAVQAGKPIGEGSGEGIADDLGVPASVTEGDYGP